MPLDPAVVEEIRVALARVEREENCLVCLAVESASRAWGFESRDSAYDVRFVYVRPWDFYLSTSVEARPDAIELPTSPELAVSGWDLRHALRLLQASNPELLEWLRSPLVYYERSAIADGLRRLAMQFYAPRACFDHYLHVAESNHDESLRRETILRKTYLQLLRPLLAMRWIENGRGPVPMEFSTLLETLDTKPLFDEVTELLAQKRAGAELDEGPRSASIGDFIESELARAQQSSEPSKATDPNPKALDGFFLGALLDAWGPMPA